MKQEDPTAPEEIRDSLKTELEAIEDRLVQANRELEEVHHAEKVAESAKEENEQDLVRKKQEEDALRALLEADVAAFEDELEMKSKSVSEIQTQQAHIKRIMGRARDAQRAARDANEDLLDDISKQLGKDK